MKIKVKLSTILLSVCMAIPSLIGLSSCKFGFGGSSDTSSTEKSDQNFTVTSNGQACLTWDPVSNATSYEIYESKGVFSPSNLLAEVKTNTYTADDLYAYYSVVAKMKDGSDRTVGTYSYDSEVFGPNVGVYCDTDNQGKIQQTFDNLYKTTENGEFSSTRFAAFFKTGSYQNVDIDIGYYTTVAGLDGSPDGVTLGGADVIAKNSLINFWRGIENFSVEPKNGVMTWSVSQAAFFRRVHVKGDLVLSNGGCNSGGFIADSKIDGALNSGSQQQWLTRNSVLASWSGSLFNMVFVGTENAPAETWNSSVRYTTVERSERVAEKPFLTFDEKDGYSVFVPAVTNGARGTDWSDGEQEGESVPLSRFYVARSDRDTADTINAALKEGKNLLLTPGVYKLDKAIEIEKANTIVLGIGLATLKVSDADTDTLMRVANVSGVSVCGILFDAGKTSDTLLEVGEGEAFSCAEDAPVRLNDLFFRVGGGTKEKTSVDKCCVINSGNVIGDHFWVWRADHTNGVGWNVNTARNGIVINGDNVTFYGLFVEHFQEYQTLWNGNGGKTYFYQSELPYDVPNQNRWLAGDTLGYADYKVADSVTSHQAYGVGVYSNFYEAVWLENAVEAPSGDDIYFRHIIVCKFQNRGDAGVKHVISGIGEGTDSSPQCAVGEYPA